MKKLIFLGALLWCAAPVGAQPAAKAPNGLPLPLVSPARARQLAERKVSLHLREVTLLEALQELQKQSGVRVDSGTLVARRIFARRLSLDLETASFARAFEAVLRAAKTGARLERPPTNGLVWELNFGHFAPDAALPQSGVAPFLIQLDGVGSVLSKSATPGQNNRAPTRTQSRQTTLYLSAVPAPGARILGTPHLRLTRADDEQGRSLLNSGRERPFAFGLGRESPAVQLRAPAPTARRLARVQGTAIFIVPGATERWELPGLLNAKNIARTFGRGAEAVRVTLQSARRTGKNVEVRISVSAAAGNDFTSVRTPLLSPAVFLGALALRRGDGQTVNAPGYSASGTNNGLDVGASFYLGSEWEPSPASDAALTLILDAPTQVVQTEVPFSFSNVPLP